MSWKELARSCWRLGRISRNTNPESRRYVFTNLCSNRLTRSFNTAPTVDEENDETTHFGYSRVKESEKADKVYKVFEGVAESYDLMNDLMSGGIHRLWKNYFIQQIKPRPGCNLLDVAGGTGDIAFRFIDAVAKLHKKGQHFDPSLSNAVVCDINKEMLKVGQRRARQRRLDNAISWVEGDAENLPFEDDSFDYYTIAFGIRNVTHIDKAVDEAFRVLKPGGRFSCLEFSNVDNPIIKSIYDSYSFQVIPVIGNLVANDWRSYQYLVESIRQFPKQDEFATIIEDVGFSQVKYESLTFGVVAIHTGFKL